MTVSAARLPAERNAGLALGVVGLGLFGVICGVGLAIGELQALVASLTILACAAVLADFRIGAVLLLVMLPVEGSALFPHSVFGVTGLNPLNLVLFAALGMHANDLGRLYAVAYALLLFTWGETKDVRLKSVLFATMGVLTIALLLTFSRGAFVGWVMVNVLFLVWKFNARTAGLALLGGGIGLAFMPRAVLSRMSLGLIAGGEGNKVSAC